ncbi:MAG: hypothetical protein JKY52_14295 [Flavobacteriales bacterium]|nr:hypothetical protein [Flavobacteriales bacterium]
MAIKRSPNKKNKRSIARGFLGILNGDFLTRENALQRLPYLFFLTFLVIGYIGNIHYAESTVREADVLMKELKELRSEYITTKFELMFKSRQSEVAKSVAHMGLKEPIIPPKKIAIGDE